MAHPEELLHTIHALRHERLRLLHYLRVEHRQKDGVEVNGVLHEDKDPDTGGLRVRDGVQPVLDPLDDGEEELRITEPDKDPVYAEVIVARLKQRQLPRIIGE